MRVSTSDCQHGAISRADALTCSLLSVKRPASEGVPVLLRSTRYRTALPDAYERLILDVINGDKRLFIRNDELEVRLLPCANGSTIMYQALVCKS